jgi:hypothetical protein
MNRKQRRPETKKGRPVIQAASSGAQQKWAAALQHHQAGRLDEAERLFRQVLADGPAAPVHFPLIDFMDEMEDFADTAALIANLDLIISVDTAVAHLPAALGKPVWLLSCFDPCWRWLVGRGDNPWYPGLRLYRQPQPGDWDSVVAEVTRDLRGLPSADS